MDAASLLERQKTYFKSGATKSVEFRIHQLETLKKLLIEHEEEWNDALYADFKKPVFETYATELGLLHQEISFTIKNLKKWAKPRRVSRDWVNFPSSNFVFKEPYGSVLIIAPWNYPIQLTLMPLIGAVAAGNTVVVKPSEITSNTSSVMNLIMSKWFKEEFIAVAEGGVEVTQDLLAQDFDYIFFTGSTRVGKIVMEAAAKNLTPVTLELGGKSPCIVDETADLKTAAKRIAWGKFLNAGQTCVAPDYLLLQASVQKEFLEYFKEIVREFYGVNPKISPDYTRVVNESHFNRLEGYLQDGHLYHGGRTDRSECYIEPTVLTEVKPGSKIMEEEIFGPILPVLTFEKVSEAIAVIQEKPKPLALYIFTTDSQTENLVLEKCSFGGGAVNDVVAHFGSHYLPLGGVGRSGMGAYHGKQSFETFSHSKGIMKKTFWADLPFRYPPYNGKLKWLKKILN
ncbi:MAG: aldehyde dehydrogenase [Gracilimonas sp.]|uniref:aldehyde dehydrogenase n=1 Tax=Gracilimonas sp. TaxID=1974203 RepID=UPI0019A2BB1C|nr:aldehyde dehydrogenase [Gracilimonas sp.]MBD3617327.1 aldehyde dehydrogenase [Gracilimonas sp.]